MYCFTAVLPGRSWQKHGVPWLRLVYFYFRLFRNLGFFPRASTETHPVGRCPMFTNTPRGLETRNRALLEEMTL